MTEPTKVDLKSMSITDDQKAKLNQLFPEVFNEDKIDFDKLRRTLGEEIDEEEERFGMTWPGKNDCFKVIQEPSIATLKPAKEESVDWDNTENLFIEGDNLEVLKLLQRSYYGKVKMIYIDPPYNTGNQFVYPDKYSESLETYLAYTGQIDAEGVKFSTNTESEGRFHSKWMSMMYPRLFLARNLLKDDGVIFISIDDNEINNLQMLLQDIFGEENMVGVFVVQSNPRGSQSIKQLAAVHEYILICSKNASKLELALPLSDEMIAEYNITFLDGRKCRLLGLRLRGGAWRREERPLLYYPIYVNPSTQAVSLEKNAEFTEEVYPIKPSTNEEGTWRWNKERVAQNIEHLIGKRVNRDGSEVWDIYQYDFLDDNEGNIRKTKPKTIWSEKEVNYQNGTTEVKELFEGREVFAFPKPVYLMSKLISLLKMSQSDIILDFFAGSCGTAHSALLRNIGKATGLRFVMVQLPEPCAEDSEAYKAGYKNIADIGKERIRRVIKKIEEEQTTEAEDAKGSLPGIAENQVELDLGFKAFRLDKSNFNIWDGTASKDGDIEGQLELAINHIDADSSDEDILYEILLKSGFELTTKIEELNIAGKKVYSIADNALLICLDRKLIKEVITEMARLQPARVVCLDAGFADNDQLKTNAVQIMKSQDVEDFRTV